MGNARLANAQTRNATAGDLPGAEGTVRLAARSRYSERDFMAQVYGRPGPKGLMCEIGEREPPSPRFFASAHFKGLRGGCSCKCGLQKSYALVISAQNRQTTPFSSQYPFQST